MLWRYSNSNVRPLALTMAAIAHDGRAQIDADDHEMQTCNPLEREAFAGRPPVILPFTISAHSNTDAPVKGKVIEALMCSDASNKAFALASRRNIWW